MVFVVLRTENGSLVRSAAGAGLRKRKTAFRNSETVEGDTVAFDRSGARPFDVRVQHRLPRLLVLAALLSAWSACGFQDDDESGLSLGDLPACEEVESWDPAWAAFEDEVLRLTNQARARGHDCRSGGRFGPAEPLTMEPRLRCAARMHSAYMAETGDFGHVESRNGTDPFDRIELTGYRFSRAGENVAAGQRTPSEVVSGWLASDGHCANIMEPGYMHLGVGYAEGDGSAFGTYWTQVFARPR